MKKQLLNYFKSKTTKVLAVLLMCLSAGSELKAQTSPAWVQFAGPASYGNYDVREVCIGVDTIGNVYTAASAYDSTNNQYKSVLVKYNNAGTQQWIKFYDNVNLNFDKQVVALLVDKAGNSYLCGYGTDNTQTGNSIDYLVMKYDNSGNQQWVKYWDGGNGDGDYITCATFDAAGNIVVAGYAKGGNSQDDIAVVKFSTTGTKLWSYVYNNSSSNGEDRALGVASDGSNNIFATGSSYGTNDREMITFKLNSAGASQWTKIIPYAGSGADERGFSVAADALGNSYATGVAGDWITVKYDPSGTVLWTNHYTANGLNQYTYRKVLLDRQNNVIVAGDAFVSGGHFSDLIVNKLSGASGVSLWSTAMNNGGIDSFNDAVLDTSGNVYVGAYFEGPLATDLSAMIVSSNGAIVWNGTYTNPNNAAGGDEAYRVAVDKNRNFYLAGLAERRGPGSTDAVDIMTLKYNALITGIKENTLSQVEMNVYPNPAKDNFTVQFTEQSLLGSTLSISNMLGEIVKEKTLNSFSQQINTDQLPKGIYVLKIYTGASVATAKIIIE